MHHHRTTVIVSTFVACLAVAGCAHSYAKGSREPERNKDVLTRIVEEGLNGNNPKVFDELFAANLVDHDLPPGTPAGPDGTKKKIEYFRSAFPDVRFTFESKVAQGDTVAGRGYFTGTHQGEFLGIPATGKKVRVEFMDVWRFRDGKLVEYWGRPDMMGLMQQLGAGAPTAQVESGQNSAGQAFMSGFRANDLDALTELYTDDAVYYPTDEMSVAGTQQIRSSFAKFFDTFEVQAASTTETRHITCGDVSVGWGKWQGTIAPKAGGKPFSFEGRFTDVSKRVGDKWVYIFDHASFPMAGN